MYLIATTKPDITEVHGTEIVFLDESLQNYTTDWKKAKPFPSYEHAQLETKEDIENNDFVLPLSIAKLMP